MEAAGHKILGVVNRLGVLAALLLLMTDVAAPASAGTLNVKLGTTPAGCIAGSWFATGLTGDAYCTSSLRIFDYGGGWDIEPASTTVTAGATGEWQVNAPAGITIDTANVPTVESSDLVASSSHGWQAGDFWAGGSTVWGPNTTSVTEGVDNPLNSGYYGFKLYCYASSCNNQGYVDVPQVDLTATENQGPALTAVGSNNLWYQSGRYVWNPTGDPWSIELSASDPSGICNMHAVIDSGQLDGPTVAPVTDSFQQCPSPVDWSPGQGATVDTDQYVPSGASGSISLQLDATNAAGVTSSPSETIGVDNVQPRVSLSTPNDSNPSVWVNHAVTLDASASTGPSGPAGLSCSVDGAAAKSYPSDGINVNGNGIHTVGCTASNNAVDPQGNTSTGSASMTIKIDEVPPSLSFEPENPANPDQVVVDTSDNESGVAGAQVQMAPTGSGHWKSLSTAFSGSQLVTRIDDAGLSGPYTVKATSCDDVGNCASTTENVTLPLRLASSADMSFRKIDAPAVVVKKRILVGFRYKRERRHGKLVKVRVGGHERTITLVIRRNATCAHTRVRTGRRRWREITLCRAIKIKTVTSEKVGYGKPITLHGVLISAQGVPVANAPVQILTAPNNELNQFAAATGTTTSSSGGWTVTLPAGPSRIIRVVYNGSATMLPATGEASVSVPARIALTITPHVIPWSNYITINGHLVGGHVPADGVALRLLVRYPHARYWTPLQALRTDSRGRFSFTWSYHAGIGVATYPFEIGTTATESDYPFAASASRTIRITFGRRTPKSAHATKDSGRDRSKAGHLVKR
jgi:hypothetical protein